MPRRSRNAPPPMKDFAELGKALSKDGASPAEQEPVVDHVYAPSSKETRVAERPEPFSFQRATNLSELEAWIDRTLAYWQDASKTHSLASGPALDALAADAVLLRTAIEELAERRERNALLGDQLSQELIVSSIVERINGSRTQALEKAVASGDDTAVRSAQREHAEAMGVVVNEALPEALAAPEVGSADKGVPPPENLPGQAGDVGEASEQGREMVAAALDRRMRRTSVFHNGVFLTPEKYAEVLRQDRRDKSEEDRYLRAYDRAERAEIDDAVDRAIPSPHKLNKALEGSQRTRREWWLALKDSVDAVERAQGNEPEGDIVPSPLRLEDLRDKAASGSADTEREDLSAGRDLVPAPLRLEDLRGQGSGELETGYTEALGPAAFEAVTPEEESIEEADYRVVSDAAERRRAFERNAARISEVQDEYFDALRSHHQGRGAASVLAESFVGDRMPKELRDRRTAWVAARAALVKEQRDLAAARLDEKYEGKQDIDARGPRSISRKTGETYRDAVLRRYERRFVVPAVVLGAEEAEIAAKREGLSQRDKGSFDALMDRYKAMPAWKRTLTTAGVITGGVAAGTLLAGGAFALSAAAAGGTAVAAGSRWFAEAKKSKNPSMAKFASIIAGLTSIAGVAGAAAEALVGGAHKVAKTKEKARQTLEKRDDLGDLADVAGLDALSKSRKRAVEADERIARHGRIGRMVGSVAAGLAVGGLAAEAANGDGATPEAGDAAQPAASAGAEQQTAADIEQPGGGGAPSAAETVPPQPAAPEVAPTKIEALIDEPGEGTDRLFRELKQAVSAQGIEQPSPALKHLLESDPNQLSHQMGSVQYGERGMLTEYGDRLYVDEKQNVWFQAKGEEPQLFLENTADGKGFVVHEVLGTPLEPATPDIPAEGKPLPEGAVVAQEPATFVGPNGERMPYPPGVIPDSPAGVAYLNTVYGQGAAPSSSESLASETQPASGEAGQSMTLSDLDAQDADSDGTPLEQVSAAESAGDADAVVNSHGVAVSETVAAPYQWRPEGREPLTVIHGGTPAEAEAAAKAYAAAHPGETALYVTQERRGLFGSLRPVVHAFASDSAGTVTAYPRVLDTTNAPLPIPDPKDFIRALK